MKKPAFINRFRASVKSDMQSLSVKGGAYSLATIALVLAILVVINVLASVVPAGLTKLDISSTRLYSITSNTKVVVNALEKDVTIYWIVQAEEEDTILENLLEKYDSLSSHIDVVKKNPDAYPTFAAQYTDETVVNNSLVIECGDKYRYISYNDIYLTDIDYTTYSYVYSFDGEGAITSAIDYVVSDDLPKVYLLEGHGEKDLPSEFAKQLSKENIETESLTLLNIDSVPEDAACIMIYSPSSDISDEEASMLIDYVTSGGKLMVMSGPSEGDAFINLPTILQYYGVDTVEGIVIEADRSHYAFGYPYITLPDIQSCSITDPLIESNYYVIVPLGQGLSFDYTFRGTVTELLITSDQSFSKVAGYALQTYDKEDGDIDGPFSLAVSIEDYYGGGIIWIGSSEFLEDTFNSYSSGANMDFAMNALASLVGESEAISIRSKSMGYNYLSISEAESGLLKLFMIWIIPLIFIGLGIFVVVRRRMKRHEQN